MANLSYIKNFRFCSAAKDELGYCLTSVEAAIEYIRQGNLSQAAAVSRAEAGSSYFFQFIPNVLLVSMTYITGFIIDTL